MKKLIFILIALQAVQLCASVKQVAIVGGGVGGASSAFYLRQLLGTDVNITIFEKGKELGGRTLSWEHEGHTYELGASIVWTGNKHIRFLAGEAGLELNDKLKDEGLLAIWDGEELVFRESQFTLLTIIRLWWRYGFSFWQLRGAPHDMFLRFSALYPLQEQGASFDTPEAFLKAIGLYALTQDPLLQWIRDTFGYTESMDRFASEVVAAVGRVNYNQGTLQLNALAGLVSLLPATDPAVFSIKGGNQLLAQRLAAKAAAGVVLNAAVSEVVAHSGGSGSGGYDVILGGGEGGEGCGGGNAPDEAELLMGRQGFKGSGRDGVGEGGRGLRPEALRRLQQQEEQQDGRCSHSAAATTDASGGSSESYGPFDAVILAAPLEVSGVQLTGLDPPPIIPRRKYQRTVTTLVQGSLRADYFKQETLPYSAIMVTDAAPTPFSSLSQVGTDPGGNPIYKLFSAKPLQESVLGELFSEGYSVLTNKTWRAYPRFDPPEDFSPFKLAAGLFYNNALENAASALEIAAIEAKNSALLAAKHLQSIP